MKVPGLEMTLRKGWHFFVLFILLVLLLPLPAAARGLMLERPFMIWFDTPKWDLDLEYRYRSTEQTRAGASTTTTNNIFREGVTLTTRGFTYHPGLLNYNLSVSPSWVQERQRDNRGSNNQNSFQLEYAIDGTLLAVKAYALEFFAERDITTRSSSRALTTTTDKTRYGASLYLPWAQKTIPTRIRYRHQNVETDRGDSVTTSISDDWFLDSRHEVERSISLLDASYSLTEQGGAQRSGSNQATAGRFTNTLFLSADHLLRLDSRLSGNWSENRFGETRSRYKLTEDLRWRRQHTDNFYSTYQALYNHENFDDRITNRYELNTSFNHQLYENLTTRVDLEAQRLAIDESQSDSYAGNLNMNYGRRVPTGILTLNMSQGYQIDNRRAGDPILFTEQTLPLGTCLDLSFFPCDLSPLGQEARIIDLDSIVLRSQDGLETFIRDQDYEVKTVGERVIITLNPDPGGLIFGDPPPPTLLVSYEYAREIYDSATWSQSYGGSLRFLEHWTVHYRTSRSDESLRGGILPTYLDERRSYTTGIGWNRRWESIGLRAGYDYGEDTSASRYSREYGKNTGKNEAIRSGFDLFFGELRHVLRNDATYRKSTSRSWFEVVKDDDDSPPEITKTIEVVEEYELRSSLDVNLPGARTLNLQGRYQNTVESLREEERERDLYFIGSSIRLHRGLSANLSGTWSTSTRSTQTTTSDDEQLLIHGRLRKQFRHPGQLELESSYRSRALTTANRPKRDETLILFGGSYEYRLRIVTLSADYRYANEHFAWDDRRKVEHSVMLTLKRALN